MGREQINETSLAAAFPATLSDVARRAGDAVARNIIPDFPPGHFDVAVGDEPVRIPYRLYLATGPLGLAADDPAWPLARALQTRSSDGFLRQQAVRDMLAEDLAPWTAPFLVALIGEYVVEIVADISGGLTPAALVLLGDFLARNEQYWAITRARVASYWDAYYRACPREEYVGFALIDRLEAARKAAVIPT